MTILSVVLVAYVVGQLWRMYAICAFMAHDWQHVADVVHPDPVAVGNYGLWQCRRCKEISMGRTE